MAPVSSPHDDEEPPLDPAAERVRQKLARLLLGSLGVMILGLIAVFGAILYKINFERRDVAVVAPGRAGPHQSTPNRLQLPAGTTLVSTSLSNGQALLQIRDRDGAQAILFVDLLSGQVISELDLDTP